ncbi:hypothetical protein Bbelb_158960 [Branchiostoma belcheri]|nr:hypothetical protein Bbelb_158960 [Branchiostoma belcheri]
MANTNNMSVSEPTTTERVIVLIGAPVIPEEGNWISTVAMTTAVVVPLLLVSMSTAILFIYNHSNDYRFFSTKVPTEIDQEATASHRIEPYAVAYADSAEPQSSDSNVAMVRRSLSACENQAIQPYAVFNANVRENSDEILPYAVAHGNDLDQPYVIQPYAVAYADSPQATGGRVATGECVGPPDNAINGEATNVNKSVNQPEEQSLFSVDCDVAPSHEAASASNDKGVYMKNDGDISTVCGVLYSKTTMQNICTQSNEACHAIYNASGVNGAENNETAHTLYN